MDPGSCEGRRGGGDTIPPWEMVDRRLWPWIMYKYKNIYRHGVSLEQVTLGFRNGPIH